MIQPTGLVLSPPLLLATDGSPSARLAQKMVRLLAGAMPCQETGDQRSLVTVMTVQPRVSRYGLRFGRKPESVQLESAGATDIASNTVAVSVDHRDQAALSTAFIPSVEGLAAWVGSDFPKDFPVSLLVRQGSPAAEILACARMVQAGLIAVGHRGSGGMRELLLGSVSTAISRYAPCSVLVARHQGHDTARASVGHVLLVVDGSEAANQAIAATRQLVSAGIEQVTLLHIQSPLNANYLIGPFVSPTPSWQLSESLQSAQREQGEQVLQQAEAALNLDHIDLAPTNGQISVQTRIQTSDAGPGICQVAQELAVDLVILGSDLVRRSLLSPLQSLRHRRESADAAAPRPIRNARLGITEDYVIHYAPCPVLLCRGRSSGSDRTP